MTSTPIHRRRRHNHALRTTAIVAMVIAALTTTLRADNNPRHEQLLIDGQRAFDRGLDLRRTEPQRATAEFRSAASHFESIIRDGVRNGKLYYNLANSHLLAGDVGQAILNYRRAEELLPGNGQIEANLRQARRERRTQITENGEASLRQAILFWHYGTPLRTRATIGLIAYAAVWLMLIGAVLVRRIRWMPAISVIAVVTVAFGASALIDLYQIGQSPEGVILADKVIVRKGNADSYEPQFAEPLDAGVEFELQEQRGNWIHIRLPNGSDGWIRRDQAELI